MDTYCLASGDNVGWMTHLAKHVFFPHTSLKRIRLLPVFFRRYLTWLVLISAEKTSLNDAVEFIKSPFGAWYITAEAIGEKPYFESAIDLTLSSHPEPAISGLSFSRSSIASLSLLSLFLPYKQKCCTNKITSKKHETKPIPILPILPVIMAVSKSYVVSETVK